MMMAVSSCPGIARKCDQPGEARQPRYTTQPRRPPSNAVGFADVVTILCMAETHHLSRAAFERLQEEHKQLTTFGRVDIARKIETARELGDLSENGDYHAAKDEQGKMEGRIRQLEALIKNAEIVEVGDSDVVVTGSIVGIKYEGDDDTERYLIGSIEERHDDFEVISPGSPLGQALLGHKVGDVVDFEAPARVLKVEIVTIDA
jgi:transcription elongation factor GreA